MIISSGPSDRECLRRSGKSRIEGADGRDRHRARLSARRDAIAFHHATLLLGYDAIVPVQTSVPVTVGQIESPENTAVPPPVPRPRSPSYAPVPDVIHHRSV